LARSSASHPTEHASHRTDASDPGPAAHDLDEIRALLARAGGGDQAALPRLRALLDETEMWRRLGDLAAHAELTWIRHVSGTDLALREMLARKLGALKAELGGPAPSPLERLMIDRIAINWLIVGHADLGTETGTRLVLAHKTVRVPVSLLLSAEQITPKQEQRATGVTDE
jgi:hypothetical protein